jgi:hypothetical protein
LVAALAAVDNGGFLGAASINPDDCVRIWYVVVVLSRLGAPTFRPPW